jgi:hypothetical protein
LSTEVCFIHSKKDVGNISYFGLSIVEKYAKRGYLIKNMSGGDKFHPELNVGLINRD